MTDPQKIGEAMQARLREYGEAFHAHRLGCMIGGAEKKRAAGRLLDLETALIGDLIANAAHGEVERTAFELYDAIDALNTLIEKHTSALAQASHEKGPGGKHA